MSHESNKLLYVFLFFSFSHWRQSHCGLAQLKDEFNFDPALVERYIELMCEFSPQSVYQYITSSEGYRLENAIKVNKLCYELKLVGSSILWTELHFYILP